MPTERNPRNSSNNVGGAGVSCMQAGYFA
jgi:hypothetical protein